MADKSSIEGTGATWNPVAGCTNTTAGWPLGRGEQGFYTCANC